MGRYSAQLLEKQDFYAKKGLQQGAKSLPPASSQSLDSFETQLQAEAQRFAASEHAEYAKKQAAKEKNLAEINDGMSQTSVDCETLLDDRPLSETVSHAREQMRSALVKSREDQLQREAELKAYRSINAISERASYPDNLSTPRLALVPAILIETIGNAVFYANEQGLLGGAVIAFFVSAINLLIAFALGGTFRYKNLVGAGWKALGWGALFVAIAVALYFNAIFSAYRSEYQLLADGATFAETGVAFKNAMSNAGYVFIGRLPSSDLLSFLMFFVGLLMSAFAFQKGYVCDDRYPGHGSRDRLYRDSTKRYETDAEVVRLKVATDIQRRITGAAAAKSNLMQAKARLDQISNNLQVEIKATQAGLLQLQRDFTLVLNTYRQKNVSVRPIKAPEYFSETPDLVSQYGINEDDFVYRLSTANDLLERHKEKYLARLNDALRNLENEGRDMQGADFNKFLQEVTWQAQEHIEARNLTMPSSALSK